MVHWQPQQRLLAHALLLLLLPAASEGLREQQASMLLSVAWHEAVLPSNAPAAFVALDRTLAALLGAAPAAALPQAVKMLAALQQEVVAAGAAVPNGAAALASDSGRRMAALSAAQACALLCVCASALRTLAVQLGQPALEQLAVPGCGEALPRLGVGQQAGGGAEPAEAVGTQAGVQQQETWQQFWQAPAAVHEFSPGEQQQAAAFLASWRQSSSAPVQQEALVAALAAVPLFKQAGGAADVRFQPIPQSALRPRMTQVCTGLCDWLMTADHCCCASRGLLLARRSPALCPLSELRCREATARIRTARKPATTAGVPRASAPCTSTSARTRCSTAIASRWCALVVACVRAAAWHAVLRRQARASAVPHCMCMASPYRLLAGLPVLAPTAKRACPFRPSQQAARPPFMPCRPPSRKKAQRRRRLQRRCQCRRWASGRRRAATRAQKCGAWTRC